MVSRRTTGLLFRVRESERFDSERVERAMALWADYLAERWPQIARGVGAADATPACDQKQKPPAL